MRLRKPWIHLECPANLASGPDERIIEFGALVPVGEHPQLVDGLIAFRISGDGRLHVELYRLDPRVRVDVEQEATR